MRALSPARLARHRLAAQRLTPESAAADPVEAARAVVGIQAQDIRAAGLALRSRVPGLTRGEIDADPDLLRTWTVRGTVHLIAADDLPWLGALTNPRNAQRYDALIERRGDLELARSLLDDVAELLAPEPLTRAELLRALQERGRKPLGPRSVNVFMPWLVVHGAAIGLPDGRFRRADPVTFADPDEALSILTRRYLQGYGPAAPPDLAKWSGLPLGAARRAFDAAGSLERAGEHFALPGTLDSAPPPAPPALLLASFDTSMLGWRTREPLVPAADDARILPGGGIVRPVLLARGRAAATWRIGGSGRRRTLELEPFARLPGARALAAETADVGRFLGIDLEPAS